MLFASATVVLGHIFTIDDSSIRLVLGKSFVQLFCTFLLRLGVSALAIASERLLELALVVKDQDGANFNSDQNQAQHQRNVLTQHQDFT